MIEPPLQPFPGPPGFDPGIQAPDLSDAGIIDLPDGGMEVILQPEDLPPPEPQHGDNLAEFVDEADLQALGSELLDLIKSDDQSRDEWKQSYKRGIELLGIKPEQAGPDYVGVSTMRHPLMAQACIRFWAEARAELLPASGPCKTDVLGNPSPELDAQAERVEKYINYWATEEFDEFTAEDSQMLFWVPLGGCAFKKIYADPLKRHKLPSPQPPQMPPGMPPDMGASMSMPPSIGMDGPGMMMPPPGPSYMTVSRFLHPDDVIVAYTASDISGAPRVTQVLRYTKGSLRKLQLSRFYRDIELGQPLPPHQTRGELREKVDDAQGVQPMSSITIRMSDDEHVLYECHTKLDLRGFEHSIEATDEMTGEPIAKPTGIPLPYVVTIHSDSGQVLSIRRNWEEGDPDFAPEEYFVKFPFLPGLGFYNLGFAHLLGGISESATALLRIMVDAGLFASFQGGMKCKGIRLDDNNPMPKPGHWIDVDVPPGKLQGSITSFPYKGPDANSFALYQKVTEEGKELAGTALQETGDMNPNAPVGTTLAILDEAHKVKSSIMRDLHVARRKELRLVAKCLSRNMPPQYPYRIRGQEMVIAPSDFDDRVDVVPVSDLEATSKTQRLAVAQAKQQMAIHGQAVGVQHDMRAVWEDMYRAMGVNDVERIMPQPPDAVTADPATENMIALQGKPIAANPAQDHMSHIAAHMGFLNMVGTSPAFAPAMMRLGPMLQAHVMEHFAQWYAVQLQQATGAPIGQPVPPEMEMQLAGIIARLTPQIAQMIPPLPGLTGPGHDPTMALVAVEQAKVEQKREEAGQDFTLGMARVDADREKAAANLQGEVVKTAAQIQSQEKRDAAKIVTDLTKTAQQQQHQQGMARAERIHGAFSADRDRAFQSAQSARSVADQRRDKDINHLHQIITSEQQAAQQRRETQEARQFRAQESDAERTARLRQERIRARRQAAKLKAGE